MNSIVEYTSLSPADVAIYSSNDCTESDCTDSDDPNEYSTDNCKLIQSAERAKSTKNPNCLQSDNNNKNVYPDFDNDLAFSSNRHRQKQSKSLKQFLFLFGFASSIIILSQLYLSIYFNDPLGRGTI